MVLDETTLKLLKDKDIPESIRGSLLDHIVSRQQDADTGLLERERLALEKRKFLWNTPFIVTFASLITLSVTYIFDIWRDRTKSDLSVIESNLQTQNEITLEQLRAEISESETRLNLIFQERQQKSEAEFAAIAAERAFQFNLVKEQLDSEIDQTERARILLFLAKSGILSTLNVEYLEELANEQLQSDEDIIPRLSGTQGMGRWSVLIDPMNARLWDAGAATVLISGSDHGACSGFFVDPSRLVTTDYCAESISDIRAVADFHSWGDTISTTIFELEAPEIFPELGAATVKSVQASNNTLNIAEDDELISGLPLILIHYPLGQVAAVSTCSVVQIVNQEILHNCDTIGGSAGGPLLSAISLNVVGFHYATTGFPSADQANRAEQTGIVKRGKVFTLENMQQLRE